MLTKKCRFMAVGNVGYWRSPTSSSSYRSFLNSVRLTGNLTDIRMMNKTIYDCNFYILARSIKKPFIKSLSNGRYPLSDKTILLNTKLK